MIVEIRRETNFAASGTSMYLITDGCGCCSRRTLATKEAIEEAIREHEDFISELKSFKEPLKT